MPASRGSTLQLDVGYERIAARCPDLAPALEQSGWAEWLPQGWKESRNDLSAGSLAELRAAVQRELAPRPAAHTLHVERLKAILADLGTTGQRAQRRVGALQAVAALHLRARQPAERRGLARAACSTAWVSRTRPSS